MKTTFASCLSRFLALTLCFTTISAFAQIAVAPATPVVPASPTTQITFEETSADFGIIEEGELVRHVFTFTNTGNEPLVLSNARGSCGCTVPMWPKHPIAVGETASITVEFNSKNKKGRRNQKVTITANTNPPQNFIYLIGEIIPTDETIEPSFSLTELEETPRENPNCFAIYPNPTAEILTLDMGDNLGLDAIVTIMSQSGQLMAKREFKSVNAVIEFQVDHYPAGTYIANVQFVGREPESKCFVVLD